MQKMWLSTDNPHFPPEHCPMFWFDNLTSSSPDCQYGFTSVTHGLHLWILGSLKTKMFSVMGNSLLDIFNKSLNCSTVPRAITLATISTKDLILRCKNKPLNPMKNVKQLSSHHFSININKSLRLKYCPQATEWSTAIDFSQLLSTTLSYLNETFFSELLKESLWFHKLFFFSHFPGFIWFAVSKGSQLGSLSHTAGDTAV